MKSLGATYVIDYAAADFTQTGETYDVILDAVGNCTFARCERALSPGGRLLLVVASLGQIFGAMLRPSRADRQVMTAVGSQRTEDLVFLRTLAESGALKPVIDRTYPLNEVAESIRYLETGRARGKVVVTVE